MKPQNNSKLTKKEGWFRLAKISTDYEKKL